MSSVQCNQISIIDHIIAYINNASEYIRSFLRYKRTYSNYLSVIYNVLKEKYPITAVLKNGCQTKLLRQEQIWLDIAHIPYDIEKDIVYVKDYQIIGGTRNGDVFNIFFNEEYESLPVRNRNVIDVGANIADSSIYFLLRGAKKVYAIEPNKDLIELAVQNLNQNDLADRIILIHASCSSRTTGNGKTPSFSLEYLVRSNNITPDVLKIDCEGCEYDIILNSPNSLVSSFNYMFIEYHYGYKNIKEKLEACGFEVKVSRPTYRYAGMSNRTLYFSGNTTTSLEKAYVGSILARKKHKNSSAT
jgi:Methyltransferase FkbM domain